MKKVLLFALGCLTWASCSKEDEIKNDEMVKDAFSVSTTELNFDENENSYIVYVTTNEEWNVKTDAEWISIQPGKGAGNGSFSITVSMNTRNERSALLKVSTLYDSKMCVVEVKQQGKEKIKNGAIHAAFSVSANQQVYFSQGNLQYQASTNTWRFAEHQYDIIGDNNSNISSTYSDYIDLFGWGTSGYNGKNPYMTSTSYSVYGVVGDSYADIAGTNYDWGVYNAIQNGGNSAGMWRTLTNSEWNYVLNTRTDASALKGSATVNGVMGMILLPDNWTTPSDITFTSGMNGFDSNTYTTSDWAKMEANGAVFLPTAGDRRGSAVGGMGSHGNYWSSSAGSDDSASYLGFLSDDASMYGYGYRYYGLSVRLVRGL